MQNTDFELFQQYFKKYQERFGLIGYKVYFSYEPVPSGFADIIVRQNDMVVTVRLNSKLGDKDKFKDVRRSAKHEAIHLLLSRLENRACTRSVLEDEIYEAIEEVVFKLEALIND